MSERLRDQYLGFIFGRLSQDILIIRDLLSELELKDLSDQMQQVLLEKDRLASDIIGRIRR